LAAVEAEDHRRPGREPEELEAEAGRVKEQLERMAASVAEATAGLEQTVALRNEAEAAYTTEERRIAGLLRAAADQREGLARLHGQVNTIKSRAAAAGDEIGRLTAARDEAERRASEAHHAFTVQENEIAGLNAGESGLDAELETAESALGAIDDRLARLGRDMHAAERRQAGLSARKEALELGLSRKDGAGALLAATDEISGLLGSVAALMSVRSGYETAVAAALGSAADAIAVDHLDNAVSAMEKLKSEDLGRAGMLLGSDELDDTDWPGLPDFATYAIDVVDGPGSLHGALRRLLFKVAVVDHLEHAKLLVAQASDVTAVTRDGDVLGSHFAAGGSTSTSSLIEVKAAIEQAESDLAAAAHAVESLRFEQQTAETERAEAQERVDAALGRLHESDAEMAAVAEKLGHLGSTARAATGEAERLAAAIAAAEEARERDLSGLAELEERLERAESAPEEEPDTTDLEALAEKASDARRVETEARLGLRTNEERARALEGQVAALLESADTEREERIRARERRERQIRESEAAQAVIAVGDVVLARLETSIAQAARRRADIETARTGREESLRDTRTRLRDLGAELDGLTDSVHKDEMARAELRLRMEALEARSLEELGLEVEALVAEYGPDQLVPPVLFPQAEADHETAADADQDTADAHEVEAPEPVPYDREEQTKRLRAAERSMAMLGKVNPLALEEFTSLEERHQFLSEQLDDLRKTRQDLLGIVDDVDAKVEQVFTEAWYDVAAEFENVFKRLFPGGEGRLILTDPQNMLTTGIDVEARPPGKKVKRLSLLSGGERALVAVTFLVALFKARPSPFYILDEVEAALDDINLGRLLEIYEELRNNSQLV
ncbi:MAG TPA: hypothetical protein VNO82_20295, partial [Solirubrobacteraceae bacterium]|nr:hypothetical protein [Solirubrobacteraceae bacterium]